MRKKRELELARKKRNQIRLENLSKKRSSSQSGTGDTPSSVQPPCLSNQYKFFNFFKHLSGPEKSQLCHQNPIYVHPFTALAQVFCWFEKYAIPRFIDEELLTVAALLDKRCKHHDPYFLRSRRNKQCRWVAKRHFQDSVTFLHYSFFVDPNRLFDIIRTKHGHGLMYRRSCRFREVQRHLIGFVEPSQDINNDVLARIGHRSLVDLDPSMYPTPLFFWLHFVNHHCDGLLNLSRYRKGMPCAVVNSTLPMYTTTFEYKQDRYEILRVIYNGEDDEDSVLFPAGAEVLLHYNMSIPNFKCSCGSSKCMSLCNNVTST